MYMYTHDILMYLLSKTVRGFRSSQNSYFQSQESRNINGPNVVEEEDEEKEFEELPTTSDTVNTSQTTMPRPISPIPDHERR